MSRSSTLLIFEENKTTLNNTVMFETLNESKDKEKPKLIQNIYTNSNPPRVTKCGCGVTV